MSGPPERLADLVGGYVAEQCTVIIDAEAKLRAGEHVVHPTRVAVRRLRSTIRVFGALFDVPKAGAMEDELVWWAGLLGDVRDLDVQAARFAEQVAQLPPEDVLGPVAARIETELATRRRPAWDAVVEAMNGDRFRRLIGEVHRWRSDPPFTDAADVPAGKVKSYVKKADKKVDKRLKAASEAFGVDDALAHEMLHGARKAGKRARYAVEAALPLWGSKAEKVISERKDLQDVLGAHQDSIVAASLLRELGATLGNRSGQNGFTYGLLYARELDRQARVLKDLKPFLP